MNGKETNSLYPDLQFSSHMHSVAQTTMFHTRPWTSWKHFTDTGFVSPWLSAALLYHPTWPPVDTAQRPIADYGKAGPRFSPLLSSPSNAVQSTLQEALYGATAAASSVPFENPFCSSYHHRGLLETRRLSEPTPLSNSFSNGRRKSREGKNAYIFQRYIF